MNLEHLTDSEPFCEAISHLSEIKFLELTVRVLWLTPPPFPFSWWSGLVGDGRGERGGDDAGRGGGGPKGEGNRTQAEQSGLRQERQNETNQEGQEKSISGEKALGACKWWRTSLENDAGCKRNYKDLRTSLTWFTQDWTGFGNFKRIYQWSPWLSCPIWEDFLNRTGKEVYLRWIREILEYLVTGGGLVPITVWTAFVVTDVPTLLTGAASISFGFLSLIHHTAGSGEDEEEDGRLGADTSMGAKPMKWYEVCIQRIIMYNTVHPSSDHAVIAALALFDKHSWALAACTHLF